MAGWRDKRVPEFQDYLRRVLGREPTERDYAAAIMQLEQRGAGSVAVGHAFRNRVQAEGGSPARHLRHYDPVALGHRWNEVTPESVSKWGQAYDKIAAGDGPLKAGQTHFFSPAGMQAYYDKDPSLVRSAVRMNVPGHGEVLVPSWATKAVAAGDFTNINGEWFLTPNERYGVPSESRTQVASAAPASGVSAPPPTQAPLSAYAASSEPAAPTTGSGSGSDGISSPSLKSIAGGIASVAELMKPQASQSTVLEFDPMPVSPRLGVSPSTGLKLAEAAMPYQNAMQIVRAMGGGIPDTGMNVPEDRAALEAQQREVVAGRKPAVMFPLGTQELPLARGLDRVVTERGVFHFDPLQLTAEDIVQASRMGRENEILGLGPLSKDDVAVEAALSGEQPVAITQRDPVGREIRSSMATPSTVGVQADEMLRSAPYDHQFDIEPVDGVVGRRGGADRAIGLARAEGGPIEDPGMTEEDFGRKPDWRPQEARAYEPTWRDRVASWMLRQLGSDDKVVPEAHRRLVGGLTGSGSGIGQTFLSLPDVTPGVGMATAGADAAEYAERGNYPAAVVHGALAATPWAIGRYGGRFLRNTRARADAISDNADSWLRDIGKGHTVRREATPLSVRDPYDTVEAFNAGRAAARRARDAEIAAGLSNSIRGLERERAIREFHKMDRGNSTLHADGGRVQHRASGGIIGPTGGRSDKIATYLRAGSHVIPADIVSHMGQGNSMSGLKMLEKMFLTGPYGMSTSGVRRRADGSEVDVPVQVSDGEFVVPPEIVEAIGNGDLQAGHEAIDAWILDTRREAIETLASLPPPAKD